MATPTPVTLCIDQLTAAKGRSEAMAAPLGLSPGSAKIMVASALGIRKLGDDGQGTCSSSCH